HYSNNNCHHLILHLHFFLLIHNYNVEFFVIYHYYVIVNLANQRLGFTYKKKLIIKKIYHIKSRPAASKIFKNVTRTKKFFVRGLRYILYDAYYFFLFNNLN